MLCASDINHGLAERFYIHATTADSYYSLFIIKSAMVLVSQDSFVNQIPLYIILYAL